MLQLESPTAEVKQSIAQGGMSPSWAAAMLARARTAWRVVGWRNFILLFG